MAWNLLALLMRHRNVKGEIVSREVFLWTCWNWTHEVLNLCVSLKSSYNVTSNSFDKKLTHLLYVFVEFTLELIAFATEADVRINTQMSF